MKTMTGVVVCSFNNQMSHTDTRTTAALYCHLSSVRRKNPTRHCWRHQTSDDVAPLKTKERTNGWLRWKQLLRIEQRKLKCALIKQLQLLPCKSFNNQPPGLRVQELLLTSQKLRAGSIKIYLRKNLPSASTKIYPHKILMIFPRGVHKQSHDWRR